MPAKGAAGSNRYPSSSACNRGQSLEGGQGLTEQGDRRPGARTEWPREEVDIKDLRLTLIGVMLAGCATGWHDSGSFYRSVQTALAVESSPAGARVFLNDRHLGNTPLSWALECEQEIRKKSRNVSLWVTQPSLSLLLSLISLGFYVPFSVIPVDTQTTLEPSGTFKDNEFVVRVEADGHKVWSANVLCGAQPSIAFRAVLERL